MPRDLRVRGQPQRGPRPRWSSTSWPQPPGRPCWTCTATRTTTAPCSPSQGPPTPSSRVSGLSPRPLWNGSTSGRTRAPTPASGARRRALRPLRAGSGRARRPDRARWRSATSSPAGSALHWACRASSTGPLPAAGPGPCRRSAAMPSGRTGHPTSAWSPTRGRRRRTRGPAPRRSAPGGCSWPTTCGSPRPTVARRVAPLVRGPHVRALGLTVGRRAQVSCNLIDPGRHGPARLYDEVAALVAEAGGTVEGAELVGLRPRGGARRGAPLPLGRARSVGGVDGGVPPVGLTRAR